MKKLAPFSCWIVTEGMAGTENQCLGIAQALGVRGSVRRIGLRQPWHSLSPWLGCEHAGIFTGDHLAPPWPDMLLVSGRKSIAAARYIKQASRGRTFTVYIQDPRIPPHEFDSVIAPEHDRITGPNVIKTLAAPNRITPSRLQGALHNAPAGLHSLKGPVTSVLIGGNSKTHILRKSTLSNLCSRLQTLKGSIAVTGSRRTPKWAHDAVNQALSDQISRGDAYVWDRQGENPYFAMLARADRLIVTNDSASMLSEAATTGKPVYGAALPVRVGVSSKRLASLEARLVEYGALRPLPLSLATPLEAWTYTPLRDADNAAKVIAQTFTTRRESLISQE